MTGLKALRHLGVKINIPTKDLYHDAQLLIQRIDAIRIDRVKNEREQEKFLAFRLLDSQDISSFPQDRGKIIFTRSQETPKRVKYLPQYVWVKANCGVSIGWRGKRAIQLKRKLNTFLKRTAGTTASRGLSCA